MKKVLSLLLVFAMLLSLCACGKEEPQPTDPVNETQSTTNGTEAENDSTEAATTGTTEAATQAPTEAPTEAPTQAPVTNTPAACSHNWKAATCTAPKTCTKCGATEGSAAGHSWKAATCTAPKTCSKCNVTEGAVTGHTYKNGACTGCGAAEPAAKVDGDWFLEGINNSGVEYEKMNLTLGDGSAEITIAYFGKISYDSQEMLDSILTDGYYNGSYYYDVVQYNGVYYSSAMYGMQAEGTYTVSGNTITAKLTNYYGMSGNLVLSKTSESTLSFVSVDEDLFDETIREVLTNGHTFTKKG